MTVSQSTTQVKRKNRPSIPIWPGRIPGRDPVTHFWYVGPNSSLLRLCDDHSLPEGLQLAEPDGPLVPCRSCRDLYVSDGVQGHLLLDTTLAVDQPPPIMVYSHKLIGDTIKVGVSPNNQTMYTPRNRRGMDIKPIPMTAFARFYEATGPKKVAMVREARLFQTDPDAFNQRSYYVGLLNTLRKTHWQTDDISTFEAALGPLVAEQNIPTRKEHYQKVGEAYINFWKKRDAHFFPVPSSVIEIGGLAIKVSAEVGMRYDGNNMALKLWPSAPKPTRPFRQSVRYLTEQGRGAWNKNWTAGIWDIRREEILPFVQFSKDLPIILEGVAAMFRKIWERLDSEIAANEAAIG